MRILVEHQDRKSRSWRFSIKGVVNMEGKIPRIPRFSFPFDLLDGDGDESWKLRNI
jgi:hypothetical protein